MSPHVYSLSSSINNINTSINHVISFFVNITFININLMLSSQLKLVHLLHKRWWHMYHPFTIETHVFRTSRACYLLFLFCRFFFCKLLAFPLLFFVLLILCHNGTDRWQLVLTRHPTDADTTSITIMIYFKLGSKIRSSILNSNIVMNYSSI